MVSDQEMDALHITRDAFHGDWNYTLHPKAKSETAVLSVEAVTSG